MTAVKWIHNASASIRATLLQTETKLDNLNPRPHIRNLVKVITGSPVVDKFDRNSVFKFVERIRRITTTPGLTGSPFDAPEHSNRGRNYAAIKANRPGVVRKNSMNARRRPEILVVKATENEVRTHDPVFPHAMSGFWLSAMLRAAWRVRHTGT
jgi:hypothetical protein